MTYKGIFEKCETLEEMKIAKNTIIAMSANPYDDSTFSKFILGAINSAFENVCKEKGWK